MTSSLAPTVAPLVHIGTCAAPTGTRRVKGSASAYVYGCGERGGRGCVGEWGCGGGGCCICNILSLVFRSRLLNIFLNGWTSELYTCFFFRECENIMRRDELGCWTRFAGNELGEMNNIWQKRIRNWTRFGGNEHGDSTTFGGIKSGIIIWKNDGVNSGIEQKLTGKKTHELNKTWRNIKQNIIVFLHVIPCSRIEQYWT